MPSGEPEVSVVVPSLDEASVIADALQRLSRAAPAGAEIVVADGGSTDGTAAIAGRWAAVVRAPRGRGPQMNAGARAARGRLLVFLHADCWLEPGAIEEAAALLGDPGVTAVAFHQRLSGRGLAYRTIETFANLRVRRLRSIYGDSGLALRRETFERCGGFPDTPLFEDLGISKRLRRLGGRFVLTRAPIHVSTRRWEEEGLARRTFRNWLLTLRYKAGADPRALAVSYGRR